VSTIGDDSGGPPPREDPKTVIQEELGEHRQAIEALADLDLGVLSEDARHILRILDQAQEESS
jgi:hypothetical protein